MSVHEPVVFGRYLLEQKLASGGMGEIFLARMEGTAGFEKKVVIKRILPHLAESKEFVERFLDEGRLVVKLAHGNIVQVLDMGQVEGHYFLAMEHVDGMDLRQVLRTLGVRDERPPVAATLYIIGEVARGLAYAHSRTDEDGNNFGIIHRDVSPSNIMLTRGGEVKLLDFGIAKAAGRMVNSVSGSLHGKFLYMSPEQAAGKPLDRRSDLFSLGIVAYEMLTGVRPFEGEAELKTLDLIREGKHIRPSTLREDLTEEVEDIVERCLEVDPQRRFASADELHRTILKYLVDRREIVSNVDLASFVRPLLPPRNPTVPVSLDQALNQQLDALLGGRSGTPTRAGSELPRTAAAAALGELTQPPAQSAPHVTQSGRIDDGGVDTSTTNRTNLDHVDDAPPMPRASRNRILIASVVLLVGVLVTLNVVMLSALREKPAPPRQTLNTTAETVTPPAVDAAAADALDAGTEVVVLTATTADGDAATESAPEVIVLAAAPDGSEIAAPADAGSELDAGADTAPLSKAEDSAENAPKVPETPDAGETSPDAEKATEPFEVELVGVPSDASVTFNGAPATALGGGRYSLEAAPAGDDPIAVEITAKGFETWSQSLDRSELAAPITAKLSAKRRAVSLTTVPADAEIQVGGRTVGKGSHKFSIALDSSVSGRVIRKGYESRRFTLRGNGPRASKVTLMQKEFGFLKTRISPFSAEVWIDGVRVKRTTSAFRKKLPVGDHVLKAVGPGNKSVIKKFTIEAKKTNTLPAFTVPD